MKTRVVITGMGAITPIGNDVESFWQGLKDKKVGIAPITYFDTTDYKCKLAAEVKGFNARDYICLLYTSPSPRDGLLSRMPSSA